MLIKTQISLHCWLTQLKLGTWSWDSSRICRWELSECQRYEYFLFMGRLTSALCHIPTEVFITLIPDVLLQASDTAVNLQKMGKREQFACHTATKHYCITVLALLKHPDPVVAHLFVPSCMLCFKNHYGSVLLLSVQVPDHWIWHKS